MTVETKHDGDDDDDDDSKLLGKYTEKYLFERAREILQERTCDWEIWDRAAEERIPKFDLSGEWTKQLTRFSLLCLLYESLTLHSLSLSFSTLTRLFPEITSGKVFGKGGFFVVSEVTKITLDDTNQKNETVPNNNNNNNNPRAKHQDEDYIQGVVQDRGFMALHCIRKGKDYRYALKTMQADVCRSSPETFVNTVVDLAIEARFLAVVRHPNIIKMRAMSCDICQSNAFIVLDRLYDTLTQRLKQWAKQNSNGFAKLFDFQQKRQNAFFAERLKIAYDIASAMSYLHNLK
jgi:serine/threonine protein kinase